ncbi:hypothetical protein [Thermocoleostomius sinensis]|jgi:hypothetical protein|uniref:Uncharacterized protein n=1 Tax=Thermocoleostomius sinensis A174 TaxID=2016057 RepID=A0A9E9C796_9CYAN|nr:hypothetical protein [Thermocoleostomius sinensis]WAL60109.1 hypothetical protein OXH18_23555 [Thermocoleostomius sinensis A174]
MNLLILLGLLIYGGGAWKFWTGFNRTNFSSGRLHLSLLWPIFLIANKSYRQNFNRALKG